MISKTSEGYKATGTCPKCHLPKVYVGDPPEGDGPKPWCTCPADLVDAKPSIEVNVKAVMDQLEEPVVGYSSGAVLEFVTGWQAAYKDGFADKPTTWEVKAIYRFFHWLLKRYNVVKKG